MFKSSLNSEAKNKTLKRGQSNKTLKRGQSHWLGRAAAYQEDDNQSYFQNTVTGEPGEPEERRLVGADVTDRTKPCWVAVMGQQAQLLILLADAKVAFLHLQFLCTDH